MVSRVYIKVRIEAQCHANLAARKTPTHEETGPTLPVSVVGRWLEAKLLLVCFSQFRQPVRIRLYGTFDQLTLHAGISQLGAYPQGSTSARGMEGDEILHVSEIVHELLYTEPFDDLRAHVRRVTLIEELTTQVG